MYYNIWNIYRIELIGVDRKNFRVGHLSHVRFITPCGDFRSTAILPRRT